MLDTTSLPKTVNAVQETFFFDREVSRPEAARTAAWIVGQQGGPRPYGALFSLTEDDALHGVELFTGERLAYSAAARHVLGEETCRALLLLNDDSPAVQEALGRASEWMAGRIRSYKDPGLFCCKTCSPAGWHHLGAGGLPEINPQWWMQGAMRKLQDQRDGEGRWQGFRFYYTLLALLDFPYPSVLEELRYAAPECEKLLQRRPRIGGIDARRRTLAERVLARA